MFDQNIDYSQEVTLTSIRQKIKSAIQVLSKPSPSNIQVSLANKNILETQRYPQSLDVLLHLLFDYEEKQNEAKLVLSFISNYVKQQLKMGINIIRHKKQEIYAKLKAAFLVDGIQRKYKHLLQNTFIKFIHTLTSEFLAFRKDLAHFIVQFLKEFNFSMENINQLQNCFHLLRVLLHGSCSLQNSSLVYLIPNLLMNFLKFCDNAISNLSQNITESGFQSLQKGIQSFAKIVSITRLLLAKADPEKMPFVAEQALTSVSFYNICVNTISLKVPGQIGILPPNNDTKGHKAINSIKQSVFNMLSIGFEYLLKRKKNVHMIKYEALLKLNQFLLQYGVPLIVQELKEFPFRKLHSQSCLVQILLALSKTIRMSVLFQSTFKLRNMIIFDICFRCLIPRQSDLQLNPSQFLVMKENLIKLETFRTVGDVAEKIIESYADKVDGSLSYVSKTCLNLMDFQLTANPKYFHELPQYFINSFFYQKLTHYQQIETCLQILAGISYHAESRTDIAEDVEKFFVRRQEFFSRIDIPFEILINFFLCYSYYQENFYALILQEKADYFFHRSLPFHALEILKTIYNPISKNFKEGMSTALGLEIKDYFYSLISKTQLIPALFPEKDPHSISMLVQFFERLADYFDSEFSIQIIEDILLQFMRENVRRQYSEVFLSYPMREALTLSLAKNICETLPKSIINGMICKTKLLQLLRMTILMSPNPIELLDLCLNVMEEVSKEIQNLSDVMDLFVYFMRRCIKQNLSVPIALLNKLCIISINTIIFIEDDCFELVFQLLININMKQILPTQTLNALVSLYIVKVEEVQTDDDAFIILQKLLYLIIQIAVISFDKIPGDLWLKILDLMVDFLKKLPTKGCERTICKATTLIMCIYQKNPIAIEEYLGHKALGVWDYVLEQTYIGAFATQKRVLCLKLLQILQASQFTKVIEEKFVKIFETISKLLYFLYDKPKQEWANDDDDSEDDESEGGTKEPWESTEAVMKNNEFLKCLPNEISIMRDFCQKFNESNNEAFRKIVGSLPIAYQSMLRNKIYFYNNDSGQQLKTFYKIRKNI